MILRRPTLALLFSLLICGCATPSSSLTEYIPFFPHSEASESELPPARVVAVWSPDVVQTVGSRPTQGFSGRLFFFDAKNNARPVDGQLVVYAFDDSDAVHKGMEPTNKPDRRFVFTAEQVPNHFSENKIGASYSFWIPWQEIGAEQKTISLVPVLTTKDGLRIAGPPTRNVLPGKRPKAQPKTADTPGLPTVDDLRQVIHEARTKPKVDGNDSDGLSDRRRATTTITMPRNMARSYANTQSVARPSLPPLSVIPQAQTETRSGNTAGHDQQRIVTPPLPQLPVSPVVPRRSRHWEPTLRPSSLPPARGFPIH